MPTNPTDRVRLDDSKIDGSLETHLESWIHTLEAQHKPVMFSLEQGSAQSGLGAPPRMMRRRGGIDLGNAYWDMEKARALHEAKQELDDMKLRRLMGVVDLRF